jgi:hypothetical protein
VLGGMALLEAAVEAMTHVLSKELRSRQITASAGAPGPTARRCSWVTGQVLRVNGGIV